MPQVTAYRCPFTDKFFSLQEREDYIKHLKTLRKRYSCARMLARVERDWADILADGKQTVSSLEELGRWIIDTSTSIGKYSMEVHPLPPSSNFRITEVKFIYPRYFSCCPNTHSAPKGKKINWNGVKTDTLSGYPAISGIIEFKTVGAKNAYMSDIFSSIYIYLGTGGRRGDNMYHFSSIIWLEDWPRIEESISLSILKNELNKVTDIIITENS